MSRWRAFGLWVALALLIRVAAAIALSGTLERVAEAGIGRDGRTAYLPIAMSLLAGEGHALDGKPDASRLPAYPALLAVALQVAPSPQAAVLGLQTVLGSLLVGAIFWLGQVLFDARVGHLAALLSAAFPDLVAYSLINLSETLHVLALTGASLLVLEQVRSGRRRNAVWLGAALGVGLLIRESTLLLLGLWVVLLWQERFRIAVQERGAALVVLVVAIAFLAPWSIRNYATFGAFIPLTTKVAYNVYVGTLIGPHPWPDVRTPSTNPDPREDARRNRVDQLRRSARTLRERDLVFLRATLDNIQRDPWGQFAHVGRKLTWLYSPNIGPRHAGRIGVPTLLWAAGVLHFLVLGLGLAGLWRYRRRWDVAAVLALPLIFMTVFHVLVGAAEPRYHFKFWPGLMIGAGALVASLFSREPESLASQRKPAA